MTIQLLEAYHSCKIVSPKHVSGCVCDSDHQDQCCHIQWLQQRGSRPDKEYLRLTAEFLTCYHQPQQHAADVHGGKQW